MGLSSSRFRRGSAPWNKGIKGSIKTNATSFLKGQTPSNKLPIGTIKIRTRSRDQQQRAWIKIAEPNRWEPLAVYCWEQTNGPVPNGSVIHHKDHNTLHDSLENLGLLTRQQHLLEHRHELEAARPIGIDCPLLKLSITQIEQIYQENSQGLGTRKLATKYGITRETVRRYIRIIRKKDETLGLPLFAKESPCRPF